MEEETRDAPPILRKVQRLDSIRLDKADKTYFTDEGYLVDHPILTSCGIFEYTNRDGSIRRELRLPEHVFAKDSLETYKGKPIIITHDAGVVDKDNVDKEQIGTILSEGYKDKDDVRAEIIIHNTDAMKKSGLKELSLGYNLDLIESPGEWNGEKYDAIQTNITINHLALVANARAGEQARLNIDGSDDPSQETLKGGKQMPRNTKKDEDEQVKSEELKAKIEDYKEAKEAEDSEDEEDIEEKAKNADADDVVEEEVEAEDEDDEEVEEKLDKKDGKRKDRKDGKGRKDEEGASPEDIFAEVKENRDRRDEEDDPTDMKAAKKIIGQQDADLDKLIAAFEAILAELKGHTDGKDEEPEEQMDEEEEVEEAVEATDKKDCKKDSANSKSKSMNADSIDRIVSEKLRICRIGDKLHLDGLESKPIRAGKEAIISKVMPSMRLDGKSDDYVDACFDMALNKVNKRKDVNTQREQMTQNRDLRADGADVKESQAQAARRRMIEREER